MGLFSKKKKEKTPELPELPESENFPSMGDLPDFPLDERLPEVPPGLPKIETHPLPSLPETNLENLGQQKIKDEIQSPRIKQDYLLENKGFQKSNFAPPNQSPIPNQKIPNIKESKTIEVPSQYSPKSLIKKTEPVFIRLDKFQMTVETFEDIKKKIDEIEELLRKTRETKQKEEQELEEWEKEIQIIKSRIESIDRNVFNKLD